MDFVGRQVKPTKNYNTIFYTGWQKYETVLQYFVGFTSRPAGWLAWLARQLASWLASWLANWLASWLPVGWAGGCALSKLSPVASPWLPVASRGLGWWLSLSKLSPVPWLPVGWAGGCRSQSCLPSRGFLWVGLVVVALKVAELRTHVLDYNMII